MSSSADSEALLQVYRVAYDPRRLARHRVTFALLLRNQLQQHNLLDSKILEVLEEEPDLAVPAHALVKGCLERAWSDLNYAEKWNEYKAAAGISSGCGTCGLPQGASQS